MRKFNLKYGQEKVELSIKEESLLGVINNYIKTEENEEQIIKKALANPIGSNKLKDIVKKGEKICIIVSDITRSWQKTNVYLPYIISELTYAGIEDKDIFFVSALGSHRKQTIEEHRELLGNELYERFQIFDHDGMDKNIVKYLGETSYKTPVFINKLALESDHIILTGGVVYHDMAGFGGGRKSILPGISSYETIMANHSLCLNKTIGGGINPYCSSGNLINNPLHLDMIEAAKMVNPSFMFNVIIDDKGNICEAVAGDFIAAHKKGCELVEEINGVYIEKKADCVIASAEGFPKDINLYQASKTLSNAKEAVKKGGHIIILAECREGIGNEEVEFIIKNFKNNEEREKDLRKKFTISKFTGFLICKIAEDYNIIFVSELEKSLLDSINVKIVKNISEAIDIVNLYNKNMDTYIIPNGGSILPYKIDK